VNAATGHQLCLFHSALNGLDGGFDVHHHSTLEAPGRVRANAHHFDGAVHLALADNRNHLGGSDIEADNHVFRFNR
jgi:hypothetical protein